MEAKVLGRYVVADPEICHGQPIFRGTRILISDVLEQISNGMAWEAIIEVIILPVKDRDTDFSYEMMKHQEETGFAKKVLGNETENVWNGI